MAKWSGLAVMAALAVGLATSASAGGGRPMMVHPGGFHGGGHWGGAVRPIPPVAGTIHVRPNGGNYFSGFGHTNTAFGGRPVPSFYGHVGTQPAFRVPVGGGWPLYGHTATGVPRIWRAGAGGPLYARAPYRGLEGGRYGFGRGGLRYGLGPRRLRFGSGAYRPDDAGAFGGGYFAAPTYDGGSVEAPLASRYVEAPLNGPPGGAPSEGYPVPGGAESPAPSYGGGPQVIVINNNYGAAGRGGCACERAPAAAPVVYRFGVGSYY